MQSGTEPSKGEVWQDQTGMLFRIEGVATSHEALRRLVIYRFTDPSEQALWACALENFYQVLGNGMQVFSRVSDDAEQCILSRLGALLEESTVERVLQCYDEPWRVYHGRSHVVGLFAFAHREGFALNDAQALALLFHDAVYIPGAPLGVNEQASAALLRRCCVDLDKAVVERAAGIVLDTIKHEASTPEARLVLDLDLAPFVLAAQGLLNPSGLVWQEYRGLLPEDPGAALEAFWTVRAKVLQGFLARPSIFVSTEFLSSPALETAAREHLASELLKAKARPEP
jgi:predicted metal-dependent HD superfamily phosphohydrolase